MTSAVGAAQKPLPRRIILSRKGLDSKAGGLASPILAGDKLLSLPIPDCGTGICYNDLKSSVLPHGTIGKMLNDLSGDPHFSEREVHLDPDLQEHVIERKYPFRAAFGQCGSEQSHLDNAKYGAVSDIDNTDLFLFFGYFRSVDYDKANNRQRYEGERLHVIHSWMQVGNVHRIYSYPNGWSSHPHGAPSFLVRTDQQRRKPQNRNNTIYTPRERLTFNPGIPGHGVFSSLHPVLQITDPDGRYRTEWRLPAFFYEKLSHLGKAEWRQDGSHCYVTQRGYGQEFIFNSFGHPETHAQVRDWLAGFPFCALAERPAGRATTVARRVGAGKG